MVVSRIGIDVAAGLLMSCQSRDLSHRLNGKGSIRTDLFVAINISANVHGACGNAISSCSVWHVLTPH